MAPINVCVIIRGELAIGRIFAPHTSHEDGTVKARPEPQLLFCLINQCLLMLALWSCGRRSSVVQAQRQIHRVLLAACPPTVSDPWLEPIVDCGFDACRTSHSVAPSERLTP